MAYQMCLDSNATGVGPVQKKPWETFEDRLHIEGHQRNLLRGGNMLHH